MPEKSSATGSKFHGVGSCPDAPAVVYAFGEAGSGASAWKSFRALVGDRAEVRAIRLPGRESRHRERAASSVPEQLLDIVDDLAALVDRDGLPYALVGMCAGALTAFETARRLTGCTGNRPAGLVAGRWRAPSAMPVVDRPVRDYSPEEFRAWCEEKLADRPELRNPAAFEFFAPMLQADFSVVHTYRFEPLPLLECPVTAVCDSEDFERVRGWGSITTGVFTLHRRPGRVTLDELVRPTADLLDTRTDTSQDRPLITPSHHRGVRPC
jgi:surfactin synthase thioesterase subunit